MTPQPNVHKDRANAEVHPHALLLSRQALEGSDRSAEDRHAAADATKPWLPLAIQLPEPGEVFKKFQRPELRGENRL